VQEAIDEVVQSLTGVDGKVSKTGDTMTGPLEVPSGATGAQVPQAQEVVARTSSVGSARMPNGTTAQRDATPATGMTRVNNTLGLVEYYVGGQWRQDGISQASSQDLNTTTGVDFTGIPVTQKKLDIVFEGVSLSGSDNIIVQITTNTTGLISSGYAGSSCVSGGGGNTLAANTSGFIVQIANSARVFSGVMSLTQNITTANVVSCHTGSMISGSIGVFGSGMVTMPTGEHITEVRVTRSGANTFDAGRVYLQWN
jgi:hypothetical protein